MIEHSLDATQSILHVRPKSALARGLLQLAKTVDPHIEATGALAGLIIEKVAVVTDAALGTVAEKLASHFVSAKIRRFAAGEVEAAQQWIMSPP